MAKMKLKIKFNPTYNDGIYDLISPLKIQYKYALYYSKKTLFSK